MATKHKYKHKESKRWTYGAELELADWPRREPLPKGMQVDHGAYTNVNSNGVAADGPGKLYAFGGEILTDPSTSVDGPAEQLDFIKQRWPQTALNYRMGLNVHIRVPGLRDDLKKLKKLQRFLHRVMPFLLPIIDPIPEPTKDEFGECYGKAKKCYNTRRKDHHTLLPKWRLDLQLKADTIQDFFEAEAVDLNSGKAQIA